MSGLHENGNCLSFMLCSSFVTFFVKGRFRVELNLNFVLGKNISATKRIDQ